MACVRGACSFFCFYLVLVQCHKNDAEYAVNMQPHLLHCLPGGMPEALRLLAIRQPLRLAVTQHVECTDVQQQDRPDAATVSSTLERLTTVAVGAAEWRTVLVRSRGLAQRAVSISVGLSNGPAGEVRDTGNLVCIAYAMGTVRLCPHVTLPVTADHPPRGQ